MRYEEIKDRAAGDFQRLTGVKPQVFLQMLAAVQTQIRVFGRPCKLSLADQLLMALMYWREYRSMFHLPTGHPLKLTVFPSRPCIAPSIKWSAL